MDLIKKAIIDFTTAFGYLRNVRFVGMLLITGFIGLAIGTVFMYIAYRTGTFMADFLSKIYPFEFGRNAAFTFFHLIPITYIFAIIVLKYVIYIALSPFMSRLTRQIETIHSNVSSDLEPNGLKLFKRTLAVTGRSIYKEILWTILFSIVGIIVPVIGFAGIIITQAYYIGYAHLDYTLARKLDFLQMKRWVKSNRGLALGNGAIYFTLLLIPFIGIFIAPMLTTAAATISVLDQQNKNEISD
jgi:CysZ protein